MIKFLKRAGTPASGRSTSADNYDRRTVEPSAGYGADAVGYARASGQYGKSRSARQFRCRLRGKNCRLLVSHVDDSQRRVSGNRGIVERKDVCARQREHRRDAVCGGGRYRVPSAVAGDCGLGGTRLWHAATLLRR